MQLTSLEIENFRCYKEKVKINFNDLTTIIGKNDIGKSTILESLEIFFNNDTVKISQDDLNIHASNQIITITCEFTELPTTLILDSGIQTTLVDEYLVNKNRNLTIKKVYDCSKKTVSVEVGFVAQT